MLGEREEGDVEARRGVEVVVDERKRKTRRDGKPRFFVFVN